MKGKKIIKKSTWLLRGIVIIWIVVGLAVSHQSFWIIGQQRKLLAEERPIRASVTYGSDWKAYQYLLSISDESDRILILPADELYRYRLHFFLYPREVEYVLHLQDLETVNWSTFNYFYIFIPLDMFNGYVNLTRIMAENKDEWTFENFYAMEQKYFPDQASASLRDFKAKVLELEGNLIYQIN